jgi:hypothetical protein
MELTFCQDLIWPVSLEAAALPAERACGKLLPGLLQMMGVLYIPLYK